MHPLHLLQPNFYLKNIRARGRLPRRRAPKRTAGCNVSVALTVLVTSSLAPQPQRTKLRLDSQVRNQIAVGGFYRAQQVGSRLQTLRDGHTTLLDHADIVNPTAVGAAANPSYVRQDRSGCYFCIRDGKGTKLRNSKAVPAPMVCGKFQLDLGTFKIGPKSGSTHPTAGAAAAEPTRHQDQTGCGFSIRHDDSTKLRNPKAVPTPK